MQVVLRTPGELVAAVPGLLGFQPERSVIAVVIDDGVVTLTLRCNLPKEATDEWVASVFHAMRFAIGSSIVFVIYDDDADLDGDMAHRELVDRLIAHDGERSILDAIAVVGDRWRSYLCSGTCCPEAGTRIDDAAVLRMHSAVVLAGSVISPTRADIADEYEPVDPLDESLFEETTGFSPISVEGVIAVVVDERSLSPNDIVDVVAAIRDVTFRDRLVVALCHLSPDRLRLARTHFASMVRQAPASWRAPVACVAAIAAWLGGDGVRANLALDQADRADAEYRLSAMMRFAINTGLPPEVWRRDVAALSLN